MTQARGTEILGVDFILCGIHDPSFKSTLS